jgi:hypothetical protein
MIRHFDLPFSCHYRKEAYIGLKRGAMLLRPNAPEVADGKSKIS